MAQARHCMTNTPAGLAVAGLARGRSDDLTVISHTQRTFRRVRRSIQVVGII